MVIDMQTGFNASSCESVKDSVQNLIIQAKDDNAFIIIAHYMRCGKTHNNLLNLVKTYTHRSLVYANKNDKSGAIMTKIIKKRIRAPVIKVCGVNTDACVKATVIGLTKILPDLYIEIITNACNDLSLHGHTSGLDTMARLKNVYIRN